MADTANTVGTLDPVGVDVRAGSEGDVDFLAAAHRCGHDAVRDERGGSLDILLRGRAEPIEESFRVSLSDLASRVLIAEANQMPVGYLVCDFIEMRNGETIARVNDLWVHPESRGIGAGAELMRTACALAVDQGCVGIDARALPGDRNTKNFFESFGLVARSIEVHKAL